DPARVNGHNLALGLRPEHLTLAGGPASVTVTPTLVESLGSEKYIYVSLPEENRLSADEVSDGRRSEQFIVRLPEAGAIRASEPLTLYFDPARIHLFDPASGAAII